MKNKKGVEMSLNVIIIAAIGLLILVILSFLVIKQVGKTSDTTNKNCNVLAGICKTSCDSDSGVISNGICDTGTDGIQKQCCKVIG